MKNNLITKIIAVPLIFASVSFVNGCASPYETIIAKSLKQKEVLEKNEDCIYADVSRGEFKEEKKICNSSRVSYNGELYDVKKIISPEIQLWYKSYPEKSNSFTLEIKKLDMFK